MGYDSDGFIQSLEVRAIKPVIPPKSNRKVKWDCDIALYAERNLVERFFNTIKQFRRIAHTLRQTAGKLSRHDQAGINTSVVAIL